MALETESREKKDFLFSVVMAIYNVEDYLEAAIESVVNQILSFEKHVQLILVNDGSPDNSEAICLKYKEKYPENIVYVKKENGGVSSARNEGIKHIKGKYVNFLDSDDKLSENAMLEVHNFYKNYGEDVDVVALPLYFFHGRKGQHLLNYKFAKTRVIDVSTEYKMTQMHISSTFIKSEVFQNKEFRFNEEMRYAEDAELLNKIVLEKCAFGVISNARYYYRRRPDNSSSTQVGSVSKDWYNGNLENFAIATIKYSLNKFGYVPKYIQYMVMYDLQWRLNIEKVDRSILSEQELEEFFSLLEYLLQYIDNKIIFEQKNIDLHKKIFLLKIKYSRLNKKWYYYTFERDNVVMNFDQLTLTNSLKHQFAVIDILEIKKDMLLIDGFFGSLFNKEDIKIKAKLDEEECFTEEIDRPLNSIYSMGKVVKEYYGFAVKIPIDKLNKKTQRIRFYAEIDAFQVPLRLQFRKYSKINQDINESYFKYKDLIITHDRNCLLIKKSSKKERLKKEIDLLKSLYKRNEMGSRKAVLARLLYHAMKKLSRKRIWLYIDRQNQADDNAEHLFKYAQENGDKNIKNIFVITKNSKDYDRLAKIGKVIPFGSYKHKIYHLLSDKVISSHADEGIINPFLQMERYYRDLRKFDFVFLQHGIIQNDLSRLLNKYNKKIDMFVTSSAKEKEYILKNDYGYSNEGVILTGLPRYDNLSNKNKKKILIMPTWRKHIVHEVDTRTGLRPYNKFFKNTKYYQIFNRLINDDKLIAVSIEKGYEIVFFPHPNIRQQINDFHRHPQVTFANENTNYQEAFNEASLLITDYSSVAFDVAYQRKPVIYYHEVENHLEPGYFDYETMGFGEVCKEYDELIDTIIEYIENDCKMKQKYIDRVNHFYAYTDRNNCKRVYEAIKNF